jgi:hypothetical protein
MKSSRRSPKRQPRRPKRIEGYYYVPNTTIVLVVEDAKIVTIKRLDWVK